MQVTVRCLLARGRPADGRDVLLAQDCTCDRPLLALTDTNRDFAEDFSGEGEGEGEGANAVDSRKSNSIDG